MSNKITFNMNDIISVDLTDYGKTILRLRENEAKRAIGSLTSRLVVEDLYTKRNKQGFYEFQVWQFAEIFGKHCGMGMEPIIHSNQITLERRL
jgi:hypothetical protein